MFHKIVTGLLFISLVTPTISLGQRAIENRSALKASYHINRRFIQRVASTLTTTVTSPQTTKGELRVYAPIPPNTPVQQMRKCSINCREYPGIIASRVKDLRNPNQEYLCLNIPINPETLQQKCTVDMNYEMDLFEAKVAPGIDSNGVASQLLHDQELAPYIDESTLTDFRNPKFQSWMRQNGLIKKDSESSLEFGYRAFRFLYQHAKQGPNLPPDRAKASLLCQQPVGDCGAMTILFCSTMAANKVPVRALPGRWAHTELADYGQFHANCELYDAGTGWLPMDMAFAVGAFEHHDNPDLWYGFGEGKFIAFSSGFDCCPEQGITVPLSQFMMFVYKGSSPYIPKYEDHWKVTCLMGREN